MGIYSDSSYSSYLSYYVREHRLIFKIPAPYCVKIGLFWSVLDLSLQVKEKSWGTVISVSTSKLRIPSWFLFHFIFRLSVVVTENMRTDGRSITTRASFLGSSRATKAWRKECCARSRFGGRKTHSRVLTLSVTIAWQTRVQFKSDASAEHPLNQKHPYVCSDSCATDSRWMCEKALVLSFRPDRYY